MLETVVKDISPEKLLHDRSESSNEADKKSGSESGDEADKRTTLVTL